tara:strand:- start:19 stop:249 length:231 start_codon:yes stop_codon:yes gene_type:complete
MTITTDYIYKRKDGGTTYCYGDIEEDSNFVVACDNEDFDGVVCDIDSVRDNLNTWKKVCKYLEERHRPDIEQLETC